MIVAFIAIAGLLLSNKDDVVSFINKHNINWFEHNLVSTPIDDNSLNGNGNGNPRASDALKESDSDSSTNKLIATGNEITSSSPTIDVKNAIRLTDHVSQTPIKVQATVIAITNPPIITTQYAPAWKSLINKIVSSNKNDLVAVNAAENVDKALATASAQQKSTTNQTPTKTTTTAPVPHASSECFAASDCKTAPILMDFHTFRFFFFVSLYLPFVLCCCCSST